VSGVVAVSVVMPVRDSLASVPAAVGSLLGQSMGDWELVVVDDGIATGMTVAAALHSLRAARPNQLILAIPVVDQKLIGPLQGLCDQLIALKVVSNLQAVGEYFENFDQLEDADVINLLEEAKLSIHSRA
jgi:putative phosphoribosyl transferase